MLPVQRAPRRRWAATAFVALSAAVVLAACGDSAEAPTVQDPLGQAPGVGSAIDPNAASGTTQESGPTQPGQAAPADPSVPQADAGRTAVASPPIADPGTGVQVTGSGWPSGQLVTATVCGNNFLNGSVDCNPGAAGQTTAQPDGTFGVLLTVALPPTPCPCVIHVATSADTTTVDIPVEINGAPTATPTRTVRTRSVDVVAQITGSGPLSAYFGGQAERELVLTVRNTGNEVLTNPQLNLTYGKGDDPTTPLPTPGGAPVALGVIEVGQTVEVRQPFTIAAPAFGSYTVKGQFVGLDTITVEEEPQPAGQQTFTAGTSTYPWALIIVGWLLLQIPLLGLYKRRPVVYEAPTEDPLVEQLPVAVPVGAGADAGFAGGMFAPPGPGVPPPPAGFALAAPPQPVVGSPVAGGVPLGGVAAAAALLDAASAPAPAAAQPAAPEAAPAPPAPSQPAPVFGVDDLRALMNPPAQ